MIILQHNHSLGLLSVDLFDSLTQCWHMQDLESGWLRIGPGEAEQGLSDFQKYSLKIKCPELSLCINL